MEEPWAPVPVLCGPVPFPHWPVDSSLGNKVFRLSGPFKSLLTLLRFLDV